MSAITLYEAQQPIPDLQPVRFLLVCECNQGVLGKDLLIHNPKVGGSIPPPLPILSTLYEHITHQPTALFRNFSVIHCDTTTKMTPALGSYPL